ncbi:pyridoxamine 5'-phosphate oxidase family protein [Planctomycetota bacterium]
MNLKNYFAHHQGSGILATADAQGHVNVAVYSRPHVLDEGTVAFIMRDRLSHHNLQSNPHAAYSFVEAGEGHQGRRIYLTRIKEETDATKIQSLRRRTRPDSKPDEAKFLVTFQVDEIRPIVGSQLD